MKSIGFPKMFNKNTTVVNSDNDAIAQNLQVLLSTECGELCDDPYFGINLKRYMFDQNNDILKDILIDEIYTQLAAFMPQLRVERKNIKIIQDQYKVYATVSALNLLNYTTNMYSIVLFDETK